MDAPLIEASTSSFSGWPTTYGQKLSFCREYVRRLVTSMQWASVILCVAILDMITYFQAVIAESTDNPRQESTLRRDQLGTFLVLMVYILDVLLKMYAFTPHVFLRKPGNLFDTIFSFLSLALTCLKTEAASLAAFLRCPRLTLVLFRALKLVRFCNALTFSITGCEHLIVGARHLVGMYKKRYVDIENDFDLDLVYVTPQTIAMSVPVKSFFVGLYRNPIFEVARFFETRHPESYLILNLCPEMPYESGFFESGKVMTFDIQDHTPPRLSQFVEILNCASDWTQMTPQGIIAVHCRGGKGRTGSVCGAWLLYWQRVKDANEACSVFAKARTDMFLSDAKSHMQTVDTPSQVRYLKHVCAHLSSQHSYFPMKVPNPPRAVRSLYRLKMQNWFAKPPKDNLVVAVHQFSTKESGHFSVVHWSTTFQAGPDGCADVDLVDSNGHWIKVEADVRISVFSYKKLEKARKSSKSGLAFLGDSVKSSSTSLQPMEKTIAGKEPGCLFYFIFHTAFVNGEFLDIRKSEMDKASKGKHKVLYKNDGVVTLELKS
eukprot:TRINITY_DN21388_c0_g1_i1.p1 TRINITY_DN21388_c0_g1~~TRINITY_DN21388_c0_g1_i1.p1  ORF type:complete len:563 (+),score=40.78 TRINITY_DN21388_c0_g1_i1:54-1691(+)